MDEIFRNVEVTTALSIVLVLFPLEKDNVSDQIVIKIDNLIQQSRSNVVLIENH